MGGLKRKSSFKTSADEKKRKVPHLPYSILKLIANEKRPFSPDERDDEINSDGGNLYEYEEGVPEEESRKNNRYDRIDNYEFELPADFEDENVESEDDDDDDERHTRMLQALTGMPSAAFEGESKKKHVLHRPEPYPASEYTPTRDVLEGKSLITEEDLLAALKGKPGASEQCKRNSRMRKDAVHAPLSKPERQRLERNATTGLVDKEFNKWVSLVKRNREASTVYFNNDVNVGYSTVAAIASQFQPRSKMERTIASLVNDNEVWQAHNEDGARLLELNELCMEDHIKKLNHRAKMRCMLFCNELKSKRIKKIKSKTYRRLKHKDLVRSGLGASLDPEMAKEEAMKQEFKRVEERMTLRHRNRGKWARRMLRRELNGKYDGVRADISEQLQINASLSRKMNSTKDDTSSSDESDEEELNDGSDQDTCKLIAKAKEKILKTVEDDNVPNSRLLSLPFMARGMEKKKEEVKTEAKRALEEYEEWGNSSGADKNPKESSNVGGRRVFGPATKVEAPKESKRESDNFFDNSDSSDNDMDGREDSNAFEAVNVMQMTGCKNVESKRASKTHVPISLQAQEKKCLLLPRSLCVSFLKRNRDEESEDSESEAEEMVDGILTCSASKETYEILCQAELVRRAFAGDDVVDEFDKEKQMVLNQEVPQPEKPAQVLPGWGQWTKTQNKKGLPLWMVREHEDAKKTREQTLRKRKDALLRHVIISEKVDKKAEKLYTKTLPFPFTSNEVYEHSMRMPMGPEFIPITMVGEVNRPEVVKKAGVIIKPVKFEESRSEYEKVDDEHPRRSQQKQKRKKGGK